MPSRAIPEAVRRELDEVRRLIEEFHNATQQRDEQICTQTTPLEQLLHHLNDMARPPPVPQVPAAQKGPNTRVIEQVGELTYERFRRQKPPRFDETPDPTTAA